MNTTLKRAVLFAAAALLVIGASGASAVTADEPVKCCKSETCCAQACKAADGKDCKQECKKECTKECKQECAKDCSKNDCRTKCKSAEAKSCGSTCKKSC